MYSLGQDSWLDLSFTHCIAVELSRRPKLVRDTQVSQKAVMEESEVSA